MNEIKQIINQGTKFYKKLQEDEMADINLGNIVIKFSILHITQIKSMMIF